MNNVFGSMSAANYKLVARINYDESTLSIYSSHLAGAMGRSWVAQHES